MLVNISFQLDTDIPEDVAKLRKLVGLETFPAPAPKVTPKVKALPEETFKPSLPKPKGTTPLEASIGAFVGAAKPAEDIPYDRGGKLPEPTLPTQPALITEPTPKPSAADLREQAVHKATELVTTGQSQRVRDALGSLGAKRVSDLKDDQLEGFLVAVA